MKIYNKIIGIFKKPKSPVIILNAGEYGSLYDYYKQQYLVDLEEFKKACMTDKNTEDKLFFVQDLDFLQKDKHPILEKRHFMYFLAIHTALLMEIHKSFPEKYDEFKRINKGIVFEYGLTNTFIPPWEILERLHIPLNKELFSSCIGQVISQLMTDHYFCGIIPEDFMSKFIDDPDLNSDKTPYGREWKEICNGEWTQVITSTYCSIKR